MVFPTVRCNAESQCTARVRVASLQKVRWLVAVPLLLLPLAVANFQLLLLLLVVAVVVVVAAVFCGTV